MKIKVFALLITLAVLLICFAGCDAVENLISGNNDKSDCSHRDADDDGKCDKCKNDFTDGKEVNNDLNCTHIDADDNGKCDKCGKNFSDGSDAAVCNHRDADDNEKCDKCGDSYSDGAECSHRDADDNNVCDHCGAGYSDAIDDTSCRHNSTKEVILLEVERTCTEDGYQEVAKYCNSCGIEVSRMSKTTMLATGHTERIGICRNCGILNGGITVPDTIPYLRTTDSNDRKYIFMGEFPQSLKADDVTVSEVQDSRGYYLGSDGFYYAKAVASPNSSSYKFGNSDIIVGGKTYYFKVEPIAWRVLEEKNGTALVICDVILRSMAYQSNYYEENLTSYVKDAPAGTYANDYSYSLIRQWLKNAFYETAFNTVESQIVNESEIVFKNKTLTDKVFILDRTALINVNYGFTGNSQYSEPKMTTDFARATGACDKDGYGTYWTNSAWSSLLDGSSKHVLAVDETSFISHYAVDNYAFGVVPAMRITLSLDNHTHTAATEIKENEVLPTCITDGAYDSVTRCSVCNIEMRCEHISVSAKGHSYNDGECTVCGDPDPAADIDVGGLYTRDENYIYFGEYPQTLKANDVTVSETVDARGYYLGSDGEYYAKVVADPNGDGYKFSTDTAVTSGEVYYFKVEPIKWRVISEDGESALILCDLIIANGAYQSDSKYVPADIENYTSANGAPDGAFANSYKYSDIRRWLNAEFYNTAFTDLEKQVILNTVVDNSVESTGMSVNKYACDNTTDKVFLLSNNDLMNTEYGFKASGDRSDTARVFITSDYSRATGAWMSVDSAHFGAGYSWLRTPSSWRSHLACYATYYGTTYCENSTTSDYNGIVPALRIKL